MLETVIAKDNPDELKRKGKLLNVLRRSHSELLIALQMMAESDGLVYCMSFTSIYGIYNWVLRAPLYAPEVLPKYEESYHYLQDGSGKLVLKALETYQTYFSTNINKGRLKDCIPDTNVYCCLGMCLKSINVVGSHDLALDMIFKLDGENISQPFVFLDSLFLKLQQWLPNYKLSSGAQFADHHSIVLDFDTLKAWEEHQLSSPLYK